MRIVIDLQGAQGDSRLRGIGRYCLSMAQAIVRNRGGHEVIIALNGLFPGTIEPIRAQFDGLLPQENIRVWQAASPVHYVDPANTWRRQAAELIREAFFISLQPDVVYITSLFEGFGDNSVISIDLIPSKIITAVTLFDLIPLIYSDIYLTFPVYERFYREQLAYLEQADLLMAISESSRNEGITHLGKSLDQTENTAVGVDDFFKPLNIPKAGKQAILNRFGLTRRFLMYSGATDERKNHLRLIKAFSLLPASLRKKYQLAIVGRLPDEHREKFESYAQLCGLESTDVIITGYVTDDEMVSLYNLCALFVFPSWHEGFGLPALEAMSCGAPVIGANTSSLPEVIGRPDALFDPFDEQAISRKIKDVLTNARLRKDLAQHSLERAKCFSWDVSAKTAITAFERYYAKQSHEHHSVTSDMSGLASWLIEKIAEIDNPPADDHDWLLTLQAIKQNHSEYTKKQLLVDISELVTQDARTGIQRVVRSVLTELLSNPPEGYSVEPVYATSSEEGYRYARQFTQRVFNSVNQPLNDEPLLVFNGDIFLGLDLQPEVIPQQAAFYQYLRGIGVQVHFVVYDLMPIKLPQFFPEGAYSSHERWLNTIAQADGLVCISRAVADEMIEWLNVIKPGRLRPLKLGWFHLGADLANSQATKGLPANASKVLNALSKRPGFLSVGTIEPRKGQLQTLAAFEQLWARGIDINLVFVGKQGWCVDAFVENLRNHTELNKRLFWLEGISDAYLEKLYAASCCLIAASEGEGFGLPLIEAAQHKVPVIARDIPVFHEVAGDNAFYFSGLTADALAVCISNWLMLDKAGQVPQSGAMPWLTWKQVTQNLLEVILDGQWYRQWLPDDVQRLWGSDSRLNTQAGIRRGRDMVSTGQAGYLLFGPYIPLAAGNYRVFIHGVPGEHGLAGARMDVVVDKGNVILAEFTLNEPDHNGRLVIVPISLAEPCNDLEVRVWVDEGSDLSIYKLEIIPESLFTGQKRPPAVDRVAGAITQISPVCRDVYSPRTDS